MTPAKEVTREYYDTNKYAEAIKVNDATVKRERAIRLYSTQYTTAWNLQIRSPLMVGTMNLKEGKDFIVATAHLDREDMKALRDAIDLFLAQN